MSESEVVTVEIMGKTYKIVCPKDKVDSLNEAALMLNSRIEDIRQTNGKVQGSERITVMAALNIAHEFMDLNSGSEQVQSIERINEKLDSVISLNTKLDL